MKSHQHQPGWWRGWVRVVVLVEVEEVEERRVAAQMVQEMVLEQGSVD